MELLSLLQLKPRQRRPIKAVEVGSPGPGAGPVGSVVRAEEEADGEEPNQRAAERKSSGNNSVSENPL